MVNIGGLFCGLSNLRDVRHCCAGETRGDGSVSEGCVLKGGRGDVRGLIDGDCGRHYLDKNGSRRGTNRHPREWTIHWQFALGGDGLRQDSERRCMAVSFSLGKSAGVRMVLTGCVTCTCMWSSRECLGVRRRRSVFWQLGEPRASHAGICLLFIFCTPNALSAVHAYSVRWLATTQGARLEPQASS